jgi:putative endonuclease
MGDGRAELGLLGESAAAERYTGRGFRLLARNWRCAAGEVDLIVERGELLVFCEVKTRRSSALGGGYEAVTSVKQRKLRQLAEVFLREHRGGDGAVRFDVASVSVGARGHASVELFEDAF